jgi:hypothetical protein
MGEETYSATIFDLGTSWMGVSVSRFCCFISGEAARDTQTVGDKLGPRARVDIMEKGTLASIGCQMVGWSANNNVEERGRNLNRYYIRICIWGLRKIMRNFSVWISRPKREQGAEYNSEESPTFKNTIRIHVRVKFSIGICLVIFE